PAEERANFLKVARGERRVERLAAVAAAAPPLDRISAAPASTVAVSHPQLPPATSVAAVLPAPPSTQANLPLPPTPLIGRETEVTEVTRLLALPECRLLTLVAPAASARRAW